MEIIDLIDVAKLLFGTIQILLLATKRKGITWLLFIKKSLF